MKYLKEINGWGYDFGYDKGVRDRYWDDRLNKLNSDIKKSEEESKIDYSQYYTDISTDAANNLIATKMMNFDEDEIDKIKKLFTSKYKLVSDKWTSYDDDGGQVKMCNVLIATRENGCIIRIWKIEDDWYIVAISDIEDRGRIYDKCDQFEGLRVLFNKILVK